MMNFLFPNNSVLNLYQLKILKIQLQALQKNKAIGCDRISARLLKDAAAVIAPSLTILFNRSFMTGSFPSSWKIGRVTALHKQGDRTKCQ